MAKRFTDSEKWQDNWFTELTNDQKVIWIYLLDHCDNAGIWKMNMKNLNYFCSTNISVEYFIFTFQKRLTRIDEELFIINKFCLFQYGPDFLTNKSKPVLSALDKLTQLKIVEKVNNIYTLSIPLPNPYLGTKDKEEDKEQDKEEYKEIEQGKDKGKEQDKEIEQDKEQELVYLKDKIRFKGWNSLPPAEAARYYILRDLDK
tara:strand:+ start:82 stop:687 length:606 start_codon:yes stop_codon:yes gene_type:complete